MKHTIIALVIIFALPSCASVHQRAMVRVEKVLEAGAEHWEHVVDAEIAECRAKQLPTEAERAACVEPIHRMNDQVVAPALTAATGALRAFWYAVATGEDHRKLRQRVIDIAAIISSLPVEHFAGLRKIGKVRP
jgi:hypothetical protein